jgi:PHD/YefM family antitoxin component YafN of YafNO toxin-antitoxin module
MIRTGDIRKLSDFRQNATAHLDRLAEKGGVEVLTVNGEAKGVVMSPEVYDELAEKAAMFDNLAAINRGLDDIRAGRVQDAREAMRGIAAEMGIRLKR